MAAVAEHLGRHLEAPEIAAVRRGLRTVLAAEGDAPAKWAAAAAE